MWIGECVECCFGGALDCETHARIFMMSERGVEDDFSGNSELDWEIFDILCKDEFNVSRYRRVIGVLKNSNQIELISILQLKQCVRVCGG